MTLIVTTKLEWFTSPTIATAGPPRLDSLHGTEIKIGVGNFTGRRTLILAFLMISVLPLIIVLAGLMEVIRSMGLNAWIPGLAISYSAITLPFAAWMLSVFMRVIPRSIEDAAVMDGARKWEILTRIFLPMLAPAFGTTFLLAVLAAWSQFLFAFLSSSPSSNPLPQFFGASILVTVPLVVLVFVFQRRIHSGLKT